MSLRLAIWDVDGTLVDSRAVITEAMGRAFRATGLPAPDYERTRTVVGLGLEEACRTLAPPDLSPGGLVRLVDAYREAFVARRAEPDFEEPLYPGALETLGRLAGEGWLIAMATGKSRRGIDALFETHPLAELFDTIHCADDGPGKPHPAMVQAAMDRLGAAAHETLIVGDATFDMQMGRAAGIHTMGVAWGFGRAEELTAAGALEIHHDFPSLNGALDRFGARLLDPAAHEETP